LPLIEEKYFVGAMLDCATATSIPTGLRTRMPGGEIAGAQIYLKTRVTALSRRPNNSWDVVTTEGTINAEHVSQRRWTLAREVGRMVGIELPVSRDGAYVSGH